MLCDALSNNSTLTDLNLNKTAGPAACVAARALRNTVASSAPRLQLQRARRRARACRPAALPPGARVGGARRGARPPPALARQGRHRPLAAREQGQDARLPPLRHVRALGGDHLTVVAQRGIDLRCGAARGRARHQHGADDIQHRRGCVAREHGALGARRGAAQQPGSRVAFCNDFGLQPCRHASASRARSSRTSSSSACSRAACAATARHARDARQLRSEQIPRSRSRCAAIDAHAARHHPCLAVGRADYRAPTRARAQRLGAGGGG